MQKKPISAPLVFLSVAVVLAIVVKLLWDAHVRQAEINAAFHTVCKARGGLVMKDPNFDWVCIDRKAVIQVP